MRKHLIATLAALLLALPASTVAETILDQALANGSLVTPALAGAPPGVQQAGCAPELVGRARGDADRVGTRAYLAGGSFLPVIMPPIADGTASPPPFEATNGMNSDVARC